MKKIKFILVILFAVLFLPLAVFAEDKQTREVTENTEAAEKVNIYFFHGDGCGYCASAKEFFASIQEEYGKYFELKEYETWYNTDNAELLEKVAKARDEEVSGVPYIVIGNKSWNGYSSDFDEEIKKAITSEYEKDSNSRYDVMNLLSNGQKVDKDSYSDDAMILIAILIVVGLIVFGVVSARKKVA